MSILGYSFEDYAKIIKKFHGAEAPGVLIGGFMVDLAVRNFPKDTLYDAICETKSCLPDAIQLLTPCTIGNGWLKIVNLGRYALTLYGKENGRTGVRVSLDVQKVKEWPEINTWFFKLKPKKEQNLSDIIREVKEAGETILSLKRVSVQPQFTAKQNKGRIAICPVCHEAYPVMDGETCLACQNNTLYL